MIFDMSEIGEIQDENVPNRIKYRINKWRKVAIQNNSRVLKTNNKVSRAQKF